MAYCIPVIGWLVGLLLTMSLMVPFWYIWTVCEFGTYYFGEWLHPKFASIPYWDCVGLGICATILKLFSPFRNNSAFPDFDKKK